LLSSTKTCTVTSIASTSSVPSRSSSDFSSVIEREMYIVV
jgi:hypothetical protein